MQDKSDIPLLELLLDILLHCLLFCHGKGVDPVVMGCSSGSSSMVQ